MAEKDIIFILSVDTEEDWDWSQPFPEGNYSVENTSEIPRFQAFCNDLEIRPTYFVDYPIANDNKSAGILKAIWDRNECEIGAHLHPWCTPPNENRPITEASSHVVNLDIKLVEEKLLALEAKLKESIGCTPLSFRSGRWGIDAKVLDLLKKHGYTVDSSVYPYYQNQYFSCDGVDSAPYWPAPENPLDTADRGDILEIPITAGFNQPNFRTCSKIHKLISSPPWTTIRLVACLWHLRVLRKLYLSPELSTGNDLLRLAKAAIKSGHRCIHMYFHSPSLAGPTSNSPLPFADQRLIYQKIESTVNYLTSIANVKFCTLQEAAKILAPTAGEQHKNLYDKRSFLQ